MSWTHFAVILAQVVIGIVVLAVVVFFGSAFIAALLEAGRDSGRRAAGDDDQ